MKTASISELKAHLSRYLAMARHGTEVQILERGVPIARLVGASEAVTADDDEWVDRLVRAGVMRRGSGDCRWLLDESPQTCAEGAALARAIDEDREERP